MNMEQLERMTIACLHTFGPAAFDGTFKLDEGVRFSEFIVANAAEIIAAMEKTAGESK